MLKSILLMSAATGTVALGSSPALAQSTPTPGAATDTPTAASPPQDTSSAAPADDNGDGEAAIVVTGIRASLQSAIATKRNAPAIVDSISAEDIGRFPDANLAESLQRITGVQITRSRGEGARASIRGLNPEFNQVNLNGRSIPSPTGRSFEFAVLSSDLVSGIDVYKSPTADLTEGGLAGSINIRSLRGQDVTTTRLVVDAEAIYEQNNKKVSPHVSGLFATRLLDDRLGVVIGGDYSRRKFLVYTFEGSGVERGVEASRNPVQDYNLDGDILDTFLFDHQAAYTGNFGRRTRATGNASLSFDVTPNFTVWGEGLYSYFRDQTTSANNLHRFTNINVARSIRGSVVGDNNILTFLDSDAVDHRNNGRGSDNVTRLQSYAAGFDLKNDDFKLHGEVSYGKSRLEATNVALEAIGRASVSYDIRPDMDGPAQLAYTRGYNPLDPNNFRALGLNGAYKSPNEDEIWEGRLDGQWNVGRGFIRSISAGLFFQQRKKSVGSVNLNVSARDLATALNLPYSTTIEGGSFSAASFMQAYDFPNLLNNYSGASTFPTQWLSADVQRVYDIIPVERLIATYGLFVNLPQTYSVTEKTMAAYARGDFASSDDRLKGNIGIRWVGTVSQSDGNAPDLNNVQFQQAGAQTIAPAVPTTAKNDYNYFLPSFNISYNITDNLLIRGAAARVLARPPLSTLSPATTINANVRTITRGNPYVKPYTSDQLDLSLEYYLGNNGIISLAGFYKNVKNFIVNSTNSLTLNVLQVQGGAVIPVTFSVAEPVNAEKSNVRGFEVGYQQPFSFLPAPFDGFGTILNYTYVVGDPVSVTAGAAPLPLPGMSKNNYNIVLYYEKGPFSVRGAYNFRDNFVVNAISAFGDGQYTKSFRQLDISTNLKLNENIELHAEAVNLLGNSVVNVNQYGIGRGFEDYGRRFTGGVRVKF